MIFRPNCEHNKAMDESNEWIRQLYREKINELWQSVGLKPLESMFIPMNSTEIETFCCLMEDMKFACEGLQQVARQNKGFDLLQWNQLGHIFQFMICVIKGEMPVWI